MYERFFGLRERPFDLVPNPRFLFLSDVQREALSTLRYGLSGPGGLTLLLGDAGTGKTTLVQAALQGLERDAVDCVLLSNPTLTRAEFYEFLTKGFGLDPGVADSKTRFLEALRAHAEARQAAGKSTAILLDEAQSIPEELLEEVRLLSNLETETAKLLNVVLAGQPELAARLNQPRLRHLKQRISLRCELGTLSAAQTASYIAGRLRIAGGSPVEIFTREAVDAIYAAARGVPRVINVIAANALIGGFAAQSKPVPRAIVDEVVRDFDLAGGTAQAEAHETARPAAAPQEVTDPTRPAAAAAAVPGPVTASPADPQPAAAPVAAPAPEEPADSSSMFGMFGRRKRFSFF